MNYLRTHEGWIKSHGLVLSKLVLIRATIPPSKGRVIMKYFTLFILFLILSSSVNAKILIDEDFNSGGTEWFEFPDGAWSVQTDEQGNWHLYNNTTCGYPSCAPQMWAGNDGFSNYIVSFDVRILEATEASGARMLILFNSDERVIPMSNGYDVGVGEICNWEPDTAYGSIWRIDSHSAVILAWGTGTAFWFDIDITYRIRVGRDAGYVVFKKWAIGEPEPSTWHLSALDDVYHNGTFMITILDGFCWLDNIVVTDDVVVQTQQTTLSSIKGLFN